MMREMVLLPNSQANPENVNPTRNLSFTILDNGEPVENASVVVYSNEEGVDFSGDATTGSAGGCTIRNVPDATYQISVVHDNYSNIEDVITVSESNTSFTFDFKEYGEPQVTTQQEI